MLFRMETRVSLKYFMNSCSFCLFLLNSASDTNSSLVICAGNLMFVQSGLAWMQFFTGKYKASTRKPSLPDRELKVHQIHTNIETQTPSLCHIWYSNILLCIFILTAVPKFAHLYNKGFPSIFFEYLCVCVFELLSTHSLFISPRNSSWE